MTYTPGDQVKRKENRPQVRAVVLAAEDGFEEQILNLQYEEGGTGWWPASCVEPDDTN